MQARKFLALINQSYQAKEEVVLVLAFVEVEDKNEFTTLVYYLKYLDPYYKKLYEKLSSFKKEIVDELTFCNKEDLRAGDLCRLVKVPVKILHKYIDLLVSDSILRVENRKIKFFRVPFKYWILMTRGEEMLRSKFQTHPSMLIETWQEFRRLTRK